MHFILGCFVISLNKKIKKKTKTKTKKREAKCVLHYFLEFEIKVGQFIYAEHVYVLCLAWMSLFIALY